MNSIDCKITVPEKTVKGIKKHLCAEFLRQSAKDIEELTPTNNIIPKSAKSYVLMDYPASLNFAEQLKKIAEFIDSINIV